MTPSPNTNTPEVDAYLKKYCLDDSTDLCLLDLARSLELRLAEANREVERLKQSLNHEMESNWTASLCDRVNGFLREHRVHDEVKNGSECSAAIINLHGHAGSLRARNNALINELTTLKQQMAGMVGALESMKKCTCEFHNRDGDHHHTCQIKIVESAINKQEGK